MSLRGNITAGVALLLAAFVLRAQQAPGTSSLKVNLPPDSPVALLSADWGDSRTSERGGAMMIDLHTSLTVRNTGQRRIRGITWMVVSQAVTPGGRASVTKPSLDVGPGETFAVRIDLRLLRPLGRAGGPLVEISLDGVLFEDLTFYGPNQLDLRRAMTALELEARRDRQWFRQVLESRGIDGLRRACLDSIARQASVPQLDVQLARGRATAFGAEREVQFAFLRFPDAPLDPVAGMARVAGAEAREPRLEVVNRSNRPVRYLELGWIVRDSRGREFLAGSVPALATLVPGQKTEVLGASSLRFADPAGDGFSIDGMTGFVSLVEYADGTVWIPSRASLDDPAMRKALAPSAEEMRLTAIYTKKGVDALVAELKRF